MAPPLIRADCQSLEWRTVYRECMPNHFQQHGFGEQCSNTSYYKLERKLGNNDCAFCKDGNFYDSSKKINGGCMDLV